MSTLNIRPLTPALQLIAQKELFEDPKQIALNLDIFKQWLQKSAHIKARTDDQFLIAFLRGCKYSLEKAKKKIDMFYTYRTHLTDVVGNRDPLDDKINKVIKDGVTLPLPITGSVGSPRIMFVRAYDPSRVTVEDAIKHVTMVNDILMIEDDNTTVAGQILIFDWTNVSMTHVIQLHPAFVKKAVMIWLDSSPIRMKSINFINTPKIFEQVFFILRSLLSEKFKKRLVMHSSLDSLYSMVPQEMLPLEYGGKAGSLQSLTEEWEKKVLSYRDYFLTETLQYGVDERKRIGSPNNPLLGIDGTFRRLDID